jgi:hypothetical protein
MEGIIEITKIKIYGKLFPGHIVLRWAIDVIEWQKLAKLWNVDIRIQGEDEAMGFYELVEINEQGEVMQQIAVDYKF